MTVPSPARISTPTSMRSEDVLHETGGGGGENQRGFGQPCHPGPQHG